MENKNVFESRYKDVFAVEVKTGKLTAKFLPLCGGRFVSLVDDETAAWLDAITGEASFPLLLF